jgi:hypothetical protein|tara:strand:- start:54 stop:260 length:207 start_codon:yes stop_codon:yes gene_type:complete
MKKIRLTKQSDAVRDIEETYLIEWDTPRGITNYTYRPTLEEAEKVFYQVKELNGDTLVSEELRFEDIG